MENCCRLNYGGCLELLDKISIDDVMTFAELAGKYNSSDIDNLSAEYALEIGSITFEINPYTYITIEYELVSKNESDSLLSEIKIKDIYI